MKKLVILFSILAIGFAGIWIYKLKTPAKRPDSYVENITGNYWWNSMGEAEEVDTTWRLADNVPKNYIPVPGKADLYMVVDDDGYIVGYKKHVKSQIADDWTWEDVNPDIPENYEAVPNLKDVYKVTYDDGSVKYYKYVRNKDDTFAFVEVDAKGNMIGYENPEGSEIPENYERVNKNQYAVKNGNGVTIGFKERVVDPGSPSGFKWEDLDADDVTQKTASALGDSGFNLDTDITGQGDGTGGNRPYLTGDDTTFAVPTLMPQQDVTATGNNGTFVFTNPTQQTIITEQVYVTSPPITVTGTYQSGQPVYVDAQGNQVLAVIQTGDSSGGMPTMPPSGFDSEFTAPSGDTGFSSGFNMDQTVTGNTVAREVLTTRIQEGNDLVTYEEVVEKTYDSSGKEIMSVSLGKKEKSRESITSASGADQKADNLNDEYGRIYNLLGSSGGGFDAATPARLRELINNERIENGKSVLYAPGSNDAIYKIALARASMMALTGSSSKDLPTYGSLKSMCAAYGVSVNTASENLLIIGDSSPESIHAMLSGSLSNILTSDNYGHVAIAIARLNGRMYICEIFY